MDNELILGGKSPENYLKVLMRMFGTKSKVLVKYVEKRKNIPAEEFFQLVEDGGFFVSGVKVTEESYLKFTHKLVTHNTEGNEAAIVEYFPKDDKLRIVNNGSARVVGEYYGAFSHDELKKFCEEQGTRINCNIKFYSREIYKK